MSVPQAEAQAQTRPLLRQAVGGDMGLLPSGDCLICSSRYSQQRRLAGMRLECESKNVSPTTEAAPEGAEAVG